MTMEMHVDQMRELAAGLWFPMKLTVIDYDRQACGKQKKQVVGSRTEMTVEKVDLAPHHDHAFFRNVTIPADLPVFTIKDRTLVGSPFQSPRMAIWKNQSWQRSSPRSRSRRSATAMSRSRPASCTGLDEIRRKEHLVTEASTDEHSLLRGSLAYFTSRETARGAGRPAIRAF